MIRLLIADDHAVVRAGLAALLGADDHIAVVGEAATADETVIKTRETHPDVVLLDIHMPGGGLPAAQAVLAGEDPPKVVVLSVCDDATHLRAALRIGVSGYVSKRSVDDATVQAIRDAHEGRLYIDPSMSDAVAENLVGRREPADARTSKLTPRMVQVLRLVAWGHTNEQIAEALSITAKTVEAHRAAVMRRLGLADRAELVHYAYHAGLLDSPPSTTTEEA